MANSPTCSLLHPQSSYISHCTGRECLAPWLSSRLGSHYALFRNRSSTHSHSIIDPANLIQRPLTFSKPPTSAIDSIMPPMGFKGPEGPGSGKYGLVAGVQLPPESLSQAGLPLAYVDKTAYPSIITAGTPSAHIGLGISPTTSSGGSTPRIPSATSPVDHQQPPISSAGSQASPSGIGPQPWALPPPIRSRPVQNINTRPSKPRVQPQAPGASRRDRRKDRRYHSGTDLYRPSAEPDAPQRSLPQSNGPQRPWEKSFRERRQEREDDLSYPWRQTSGTFDDPRRQSPSGSSNRESATYHDPRLASSSSGTSHDPRRASSSGSGSRNRSHSPDRLRSRKARDDPAPKEARPQRVINMELILEGPKHASTSRSRERPTDATQPREDQLQDKEPARDIPAANLSLANSQSRSSRSNTPGGLPGNFSRKNFKTVSPSAPPVKRESITPTSAAPLLPNGLVIDLTAETDSEEEATSSTQKGKLLLGEVRIRTDRCPAADSGPGPRIHPDRQALIARPEIARREDQAPVQTDITSKTQPTSNSRSADRGDIRPPPLEPIVSNALRLGGAEEANRSNKRKETESDVNDGLRAQAQSSARMCETHIWMRRVLRLMLLPARSPSGDISIGRSLSSSKRQKSSEDRYETPGAYGCRFR